MIVFLPRGGLLPPAVVLLFAAGCTTPEPELPPDWDLAEVDRWTSPLTGERYLRLAMLGFPGGIELYFFIPEAPEAKTTDLYVWPAAGRTAIVWFLDGERVELPLKHLATPTQANESERAAIEPEILRSIVAASHVEVELNPGRRLVLAPRHKESLRRLTGVQILAPVLR